MRVHVRLGGRVGRRWVGGGIFEPSADGWGGGDRPPPAGAGGTCPLWGGRGTRLLAGGVLDRCHQRRATATHATRRGPTRPPPRFIEPRPAALPAWCYGTGHHRRHRRAGACARGVESVRPDGWHVPSLGGLGWGGGSPLCCLRPPVARTSIAFTHRILPSPANLTRQLLCSYMFSFSPFRGASSPPPPPAHHHVLSLTHLPPPSRRWALLVDIVLSAACFFCVFFGVAAQVAPAPFCHLLGNGIPCASDSGSRVVKAGRSRSGLPRSVPIASSGGVRHGYLRSPATNAIMSSFSDREGAGRGRQRGWTSPRYWDLFREKPLPPLNPTPTVGVTPCARRDCRLAPSRGPQHPDRQPVAWHKNWTAGHGRWPRCEPAPRSTRDRAELEPREGVGTSDTACPPIISQ